MSTQPIATSAADAVLARLEEAIAAQAFPGAALVVTDRRQHLLELYAGRFTYDRHDRAVAADAVYDLASLTKVLVTTPLVMRLYEAGRLDLDQPISSVIGEFLTGDPRRARVTFAHLLAHSSGLPAHRKYYEHAKTRDELVEHLFTTPLEADPGTRAEYSDIGFMLLGIAIERVSGVPLDELARRDLFVPLGLNFAFGPLFHVTNVPPTLEAVDFRNRRLDGQVNDENAWVMGGVAGHAGLFGTARDVAAFARHLLNGGAPLCEETTLRRFTTRLNVPSGSSRTLGWDTPTPPSQSGKYFSPQSFGHLGYTGTSLWIDPERGIAVTLLTNRTFPDNHSQAIKQFRPLIHDAVFASLRLA